MTIDFNWQNLIVLLAVIAALGYLARTAWSVMARRKATACGGCGNCPAAEESAGPQVISIGGPAVSDNGTANRAHPGDLS